MEKEFIESNIVMLGSFKPSIYDKFFFIKSDLILEDEFHDNTVFSPNFSRISSDNLIINITPSKIVLVSPKHKYEKLVSSALKMGENVESISAIGCNFKWFLFLDRALGEYTRAQFSPIKNDVINKSFKDDGAAFGYYASKEFEESRMKLDIKPMAIKDIQTQESKTALSFDFNFHTETDSNDKLNVILGRHDLFNSEVDRFINEYE